MMLPLSRDLRRALFGFRAKITCLIILAILFATALEQFFIYRLSLDNQFQELREQIKISAQLAAMQVGGDRLLEVPATRQGMQSEAYRQIASKLEEIKASNPRIKYIYTLRPTEKPDIWQFVVDLNPEIQMRGKKKLTAFPGDPYFVARFPAMLRGLNEASVDEGLMTDEWGTTLSGYAPIRRAAGGGVVGVLGLDIDAGGVRAAQRRIHQTTLWVLVLGSILSVILGLVMGDRISRRLHKLIDGTRLISAGDLEHRVEMDGHDEIAELSASFNDMTGSLSRSRKELEEYFYRVVQTLVRILEAKDKYTQGHSERVGVYAKKIALEMGFADHEAEALRKAGELHDIGKLVTEGYILNKSGELVEEEWEVIRRHPALGAAALEPVCFNELIIQSVLQHHERYDGEGYPSKLKGDQISVYAQVVSVADAYDAMTTSRSYRKAMDKKVALEEIRKNAGTQFRHDVAAACIRALGAESFYH